MAGLTYTFVVSGLLKKRELYLKATITSYLGRAACVQERRIHILLCFSVLVLLFERGGGGGGGEETTTTKYAVRVLNDHHICLLVVCGGCCFEEPQ